MDSATHEQVSRLLRRGLNHYGLGEVEEAIRCWEKVQELDPENATAGDYLRNARQELGGSPMLEDGTRPTEGSVGDVTEPGDSGSAATSIDDRVAAALALYRVGRLEEARAGLEEAAAADTDRLDIQGYLELVRGQLVKQFEQEIGDRGRVVKLAVPEEELVRLNLGPEEGYVLSQVDGALTIDELLSLSNMGRFRTLELVAGLLRDRIIE